MMSCMRGLSASGRGDLDRGGESSRGKRDHDPPPARTPSRPNARSRRRAATDTGSRPASTAASVSSSCARTSGWARNASRRPASTRSHSHARACPLRRACERAARFLRGAEFGDDVATPRRPAPASSALVIDAARRPRAAVAMRRPGAAPRRSAPTRARRRAGIEVGLVDDDEVGELHHALLDRLQLVAGVRQLQEQEHVGHAGDRGLALADADGLDDHDVVAGSLDDAHRLARRRRDAAERSAARARPDERARR